MTFLDAAKEESTAHLVPFYTLRRPGLRPAEAFALQPEDLDFEARKIQVERALSDGVVGDTKTGETRIVDMSQGARRVSVRLLGLARQADVSPRVAPCAALALLQRSRAMLG